MRFGTWNVRGLCRVASLKIVATELTKCKLDLLSVQEVRWDNDGSEPADDSVYLYGNGNANYCLGTRNYISS